MVEVWYDRDYVNYGQYIIGTGSNYFTNCTFTTATTALTYVNVTTTTPIYSSIGRYDWTPIKMANGPGSMNHKLWKQWNADYVKDKDEARRQAELEDERRQIAAHARVLASCVQAAQGQGTRLEVLNIARLDEYNDDEWRTVEDAHQRAYEVRVEAERARNRNRLAMLEAQRKAEVLLLSILSAEQKREWLEHKRVTHVSSSGRIWRLFPQWAGGVTLMNGDVRRATLCLHTAERIPEADNIVGLLLSLRHGDEDHLISIANLSAGELTEDELQIRRERRKARGPVIDPGILRDIRANGVPIDYLDAEEMPA